MNIYIVPTIIGLISFVGLLSTFLSFFEKDYTEDILEAEPEKPSYELTTNNDDFFEEDDVIINDFYSEELEL